MGSGASHHQHRRHQHPPRGLRHQAGPPPAYGSPGHAASSSPLSSPHAQASPSRSPPPAAPVSYREGPSQQQQGPIHGVGVDLALEAALEASRREALLASPPPSCGNPRARTEQVALDEEEEEQVRLAIQASLRDSSSAGPPTAPAPVSARRGSTDSASASTTTTAQERAAREEAAFQAAVQRSMEEEAARQRRLDMMEADSLRQGVLNSLATAPLGLAHYALPDRAAHSPDPELARDGDSYVRTFVEEYGPAQGEGGEELVPGIDPALARSFEEQYGTDFLGGNPDALDSGDYGGAAPAGTGDLEGETPAAAGDEGRFLQSFEAQYGADFLGGNPDALDALGDLGDLGDSEEEEDEDGIVFLPSPPQRSYPLAGQRLDPLPDQGRIHALRGLVGADPGEVALPPPPPATAAPVASPPEAGPATAGAHGTADPGEPGEQQYEYGHQRRAVRHTVHAIQAAPQADVVRVKGRARAELPRAMVKIGGKVVV